MSYDLNTVDNDLITNMLQSKEKTDKGIDEFRKNHIDYSNLIDYIVFRNNAGNPVIKRQFTEPTTGNVDDMISKCLDGVPVDINGCRTALDQFKSSDLNQTHPNKLLRLLQGLQFQIVNNNGLNNVESVESWASRLEGKIGKDRADVIKGNENLMKYLDGVVIFMNSFRGLAILNKNYNPVGDKAQAVPPTDVNFGKIGASYRPLGYMAGAGLVDVLSKQVKLFQNRLLAINLQSGGRIDITNQSQLNSLADTMLDPNRLPEDTWSEAYKQVYDILKKYLQAKGKAISEGDDNRIRAHIASLLNAEMQLSEKLSMLHNYSALLEKGVNDGQSKVTLDHISAWNQTHGKVLQRVVRKQNALLQILTAIQEALSKL